MYPFYQSQRPYAMQNRQRKSRSMGDPQDFRSTQLPTLPSKLVTHYCNMISQKSDVISTSELTYSLDKFVSELEHHNSQQQQTNLNDIFAVLILVRPATLISVAEHQFFTLLRTSLIPILQNWRRTSNLNETELFMFRNITKLLKILFKKAKNINIYPPWLSDSLLLENIVSCLTDIAVSGKFLHEKNGHEMKIFTRLLNIYANYQQLLSDENSLNKDKLVQLLDPITQCLTSSHYINSFDKLLSDHSSLSAGDKFFLVKCPTFLISYTGSRLGQTMNSLLTAMLPQYVTLFDKLMPSVNQWKRSMMRSVNHLLTIVNHGSTNAKVVANYLPFIDHVLKLIDTPTFYNNLEETLSNPKTILINTAVSFLVDMIDEPIILAHIKQKRVTPSFHRFTLAKYEPLMYNAYTILAFTTTEEDIKGMHNAGVLLSTVVKSLKNTIDRKPDNRDEIDQLLETLKGLVQHDQMKEEVLKQNALPFLLECTNKLTRESLTLVLETLWTMTFLKEAANALLANPAFLEKIQTASKTNSDEALKKAADGLIWKLVREPAFLKKVAENNEEEEEEEGMVETTSVKTTKVVIGEDGKKKIVKATKRTSIAHAERTFQYDIMISYCHADKELIIELHKFLLSQGFKVWIDLDNMFGPAMSAMADAVENSEFIILCMSDSYKRSTYCQAEAEYAFNCKRRLVPLIARPGYRADGWLGFMIGSRIYIDFGAFEFDVACEKLMNEIYRQKKQPLPAKAAQPVQNGKPVVPVQTKSEKSALKTPAHVVSNVHMNRKAGSDFHRKPIDHWLESDVLDFLFTNHLHELMPLCEKMNGRALVQLYRMCSKKSNRTYTLLNDELKSSHQLKLSISTYTRFLSVIEGIVPPPPPPLLPPPLPPSLPPALPLPLSPALPLPLSPALPLPLPPALPLAPLPLIPAIKQPASNGQLPYDILITSNASPSQMLQMVAHVGRQLRAKYPEQQHVRFAS